MREPEPMSYYAVRDVDGNVRVCHAVTERAPADGILISEAEANAISASYRGPRPARKAPADPEGLAAIVLSEAKDNIVAVVNEANRERDEAFTVLLNEVKGLEHDLAPRIRAVEAVINALATKATEELAKGGR